MKKEIHPESYRLVVFKDVSLDYAFLTHSTVPSRETIVWEDGKEYPLVKLEISHKSHPFYTGKMKLIDTAGRVDKFRSRFEKQKEIKEQASKKQAGEKAAAAAAVAAAAAEKKKAPAKKKTVAEEEEKKPRVRRITKPKAAAKATDAGK